LAGLDVLERKRIVAGDEVGKGTRDDGLELVHFLETKKGRRLTASLVGPGSLGQRGFGLLRDLSKRRLIVNGKVGKHFAIDVDRRLFQSVHERAVAQAQLAYRGVDPRNPQAAELALLVAAVSVLVLARLHHRF